jgi:hypothetical protein
MLVGKPNGKRPLGRPRRRWEDNIKMDLQEVGVVGTGWSWLRVGTGGGHLLLRQGTFGLHKNAGNFLTGCKDWLAYQEGLCCVE